MQPHGHPAPALPVQTQAEGDHALRSDGNWQPPVRVAEAWIENYCKNHERQRLAIEAGEPYDELDRGYAIRKLNAVDLELLDRSVAGPERSIEEYAAMLGNSCLALLEEHGDMWRCRYKFLRGDGWVVATVADKEEALNFLSAHMMAARLDLASRASCPPRICQRL